MEILNVDHFVKQLQTLIHTVDFLVLCQDLIVFAEADHKKDGCDIVEAVDPLLPLRPLTPDVQEVEGDVSILELDLDDSSGSHSSPENILVGRLVFGATQALHIREEVMG